MEEFDPKEFERIVTEIGELYGRFRTANKSDTCPVAPNDHIVGVIGEWRAIQIIKNSTGLTAKKAAKGTNALDDLELPDIKNERGEPVRISVKTLTDHAEKQKLGGAQSKRGKTGAWAWLLCIRLNKDLSLAQYFWVSRETALQHLKRPTLWHKAESFAEQFPYSLETDRDRSAQKKAA